MTLEREKEKKEEVERKISAHADGGPRSRVCARETLRSAPHRRERKFSGARVCRIAFIPPPQLLRTHIQLSNLRKPLFSLQKYNRTLPAI